MGIIDFSFRAKPYAGIAQRAGRSPSVARKLPEQRPRSPRGMVETGKPQRGASGGMQGGPRRGRSPITGPALPPPEAAQTTEKKGHRARRAQKSPLKGKALLCFLQSACQLTTLAIQIIKTRAIPNEIALAFAPKDAHHSPAARRIRTTPRRGGHLQTSKNIFKGTLLHTTP